MSCFHTDIIYVYNYRFASTLYPRLRNLIFKANMHLQRHKGYTISIKLAHKPECNNALMLFRVALNRTKTRNVGVASSTAPHSRLQTQPPNAAGRHACCSMPGLSPNLIIARCLAYRRNSQILSCAWLIAEILRSHHEKQISQASSRGTNGT